MQGVCRGTVGELPLCHRRSRSSAISSAAVAAAVGRSPKIRFIDTPAALRDKYQYFTRADITKLRSAGFDQPFHSLEDGIRDFIGCLQDAG